MLGIAVEVRRQHVHKQSAGIGGARQARHRTRFPADSHAGTYGGVSVRKFSDIINELANVAPLSKGADYLAVSLRIVRWARENWLAGKLDISGRLNGGGVLTIVRADPFLDFFREVVGTELVWRIRYLPEGSRLPREGFWGDLAISDDAASQLRGAIAAGEQEGTAASAISGPVHPATSRGAGPKAVVGPRVRQAMRADISKDGIDVKQLEEMTQSEMKERYKASESTCRKARKEVLAEF
jgi:hypothetical protein